MSIEGVNIARVKLNLPTYTQFWFSTTTRGQHAWKCCGLAQLRNVIEIVKVTTLNTLTTKMSFTTSTLHTQSTALSLSLSLTLAYYCSL